MKTIRDITFRLIFLKRLKKSLTRSAGRSSAHTELTEYVPTNSVRDHYRRLLKAIAESPAEPQEGIGVWISDSRLGKIELCQEPGLCVANRTLGSCTELFNERMEDRRIGEY